MKQQPEETAPSPSEETSSSQPRSWRDWLRLSLLTLGALLLVGFCSIVGTFWYMSHDLPDLTSLKKYRPWRMSRIYARDRTLAMEVAHQYRTPIPYDRMPKHLVHAVVAAEDANFFHHQGLDYFGILRAFWKNLRRTEGAPKQGGSTITQQVVKTFLLSPEQTYTRKLREAMLARQLEQNLKKEEILYLYLNQIDFGNQRHGVEAAAQFYFGKSTHQLTLAESAILAGIPKNPERYNPSNSKTLTRKRRNYVLRQMWRNGWIDEATYQSNRTKPIPTPPTHNRPTFPRDYYTEEVRRRALKHLQRYLAKKKVPKKQRKAQASLWLYRRGLKIETALDPALQKKAIQTLKENLFRLDKRQGYRGPIAHLQEPQLSARLRLWKASPPTPKWGLTQAVVLRSNAHGVYIQTPAQRGRIPWNTMQWARRRLGSQGITTTPAQQVLRTGDLIQVRPTPQSPSQPKGLPTFTLEQVPRLQGALIAIEPFPRKVRALVGGFDFQRSPYNRATQALRQPGSAFKPLVYASAIASRKYTAASLVNDTYFRIVRNGKRWSPQNHNRRYRNRPVRLRTALTHSINTVAVRVLDRITPQRVIHLAKRLGIRSPLTPLLPLALGSSALRPLELTNAYATLAAQGIYEDPVLITRILDHQGNVLYEHLPNPRRALSSGVSYIVTSMMEDVVAKGTAKAALQLGRPVAGKTGTTNASRNAWFIGYTPELCVGVWIGHDDRTPIGKKATGSNTALPVFIDFLERFYKEPKYQERPIRPFKTPDEVVFFKIDPRNGKRAPTESPHYLFETFLPGTQPTRFAKTRDDSIAPEDFYK